MQADILTALNAIEVKVLYGILKAAVAVGIALFLKARIENWVAYFQFMSNKKLGSGVKVSVRGKSGKITDYNKKWIFIDTDEGEIIIPIKGWLSEKWTLLKNSKDKEGGL
jgi:hypothetical protein